MRFTREMEEEFLSKRKVVISGLPFDSSNDLVSWFTVIYSAAYMDNVLVHPV